MLHNDLLRLLGGNAFGILRLRQLGNNAGGHSLHGPVPVDDDLHRATLNHAVPVNLLENIIRVSGGIPQRTPGHKPGAVIPACQGDQPFRNPGGILFIQNGRSRRGAPDKGHAVSLLICDGLPAVQGLNLLRCQQPLFRSGRSLSVSRGQRAAAGQHHHKSSQHRKNLFHPKSVLSG